MWEYLFDCPAGRLVSMAKESLYHIVTQTKAQYGHVDKIIVPRTISKFQGIPVCSEDKIDTKPNVLSRQISAGGLTATIEVDKQLFDSSAKFRTYVNQALWDMLLEVLKKRRLIKQGRGETVPISEW
jgi:hypothetical protein